MPAQKTAPTHATVKRSGLRVLLVEDNFINQTLIRKMLERRGIKKDDIVVAANGLEAIEVVQGLRSPPGQPFLADLVLMDCQMPVMNGFDAARRIRAIGLALPIIALTASTIKEDIDECYASGMNYYLSKPVNINELINIINSLTADQGSEYA
jgi:CheY-like chemotaxis protein